MRPARMKNLFTPFWQSPTVYVRTSERELLAGQAVALIIIDRSVSYARKKDVELTRRLSSTLSERRSRTEEMESHRKTNGPRVRNARTNRQTVPRKVPSLSPRYHNHLDAAIVSAAWTKEEEEKLYRLHDEVGNKWSAIALRLAGR